MAGIQVASLFATIGVDTNPLTKGLKGALGAFASFSGAVIAAKKLMEFSREGAQMKRLENTSVSLARTMGMSMNSVMDSVRAASLGMVSDSDIMQASSRAMMLGVGESAEQLGQLMQVAAIRARAMGLSTTQAFNDIVTGIGRMSPMILDNLGIVTGGEKTFEEYAASIGKTADALTDAEKKQALIGKAIETTAPLMAQEGSSVRDIAGNWEYAAAQVKNYIDNKKKALALESGGAGEMKYVNGLPVGTGGMMGYVQTTGMLFERASVDAYNKALLELASSLGLIEDWRVNLANAPILGTQDIRAEWVTKLLPALNEYDRLVNETGMSSEIASAKIKYLFDTFGMAAFTEGSNDWAEMNDRVYEFGSSASGAISKIEAINAISLSAARDEYLATASVLKEELAGAYDAVRTAEENWRSGVAGQIKVELDEKKNAGELDTQGYISALETLDNYAGTQYAYEFKISESIPDLVKSLLEDPEGFLGKMSGFEDAMMPLDTSVKNAMELVAELQGQLEDLEREYSAYVNIKVRQLNGGLAVGNTSEWAVPHGTHASGGYAVSNTPYIVGERGPEVFVPNANGQIVANNMLGGGSELLGDILMELQNQPSRMKVAIREAMALVGG